MRTSRLAPVLCCLGVLAAIGSLLAGAPVTAQGDERRITITLESPPSFVPAIDLRLSRGPTDITDAECGPITTPTSASYPRRQCTELGDGTFAVSLTGVPADAVVTWDCVEIVAARTEHTAIPLGGGFSEWWCDATVSPPGVIIDGTYSVGDDGLPLDDLELIVEDDTGTAIPPCELDERSGVTRQWCGPLADGTYEAIPQDVPAGLRAAVACADFPQTSDSRSGPFTIDAESPRWFCEQPVPFEPLIFGLSWNGATGRDLGWFLETEPTVTDADGTEISASCTESSRSADEPTNLFIEFSCVGLDAGSYTVTFSGIPSDFGVETDCEPVEVPEQPGLEPELCYVTVTSEPLDVPTVEEPADPAGEADPPELPATGTASSTLLTIGLAALASGATLLVAGRRRSLR